MHSTRELRHRVQSVGNTARITKAMQMVAASKMRKAQQAAIAGRPFTRLLYRMQREVTTGIGDLSHPLLERREVRKRGIILIAADRGLCGALNSNVFRLALEFDPKSAVFITAGRKAAQFVASTRRTLAAEFVYSDTPRFEEARAIAGFARDLFLKGKVDEVRVVTTQFVDTMTQKPVNLEFLPVGEIKNLEMPGAEPEDRLTGNTAEYVFEPQPQAILSYLLSHYLNIYIYQALLNAKASEQSARMVSMKNATENANTLIKDLTLEYNKLRQGNITTELLDIAGGEAA
jgi:F-type H+-transporting ATPase subunit gamma